MSARCVSHVRTKELGRYAATLARWKDGRREWFAVELDGSTVQTFDIPRFGGVPAQSGETLAKALLFFDGFVAGFVAHEEAVSC